MEAWIESTLIKLKRMYEEYEGEEPALEAYLVCMTRMLNGLVEMGYSQFHIYEKEVIWNAMEMAFRHFIEQTELVRKTKDVKEKKLLLDDIEDSVSMLAEVYKNVIDGTENSDRYMMSNMAVDTNMFELSPKVCVFYSKMLNSLVSMFCKDADQYAFILHPSLRNNTETKLLFQLRDAPGKVAIIYISQSIIEEFGVVSVYLIHEAFHVLTRTPRLRKLRWQYFFEHMVQGLQQLIFRGVTFYENDKKDKEMKERLMSYWIVPLRDKVAELKQEPENSKQFYSKHLRRWGISCFQQWILQIEANIGDVIKKNYCEAENEDDLKTFIDFFSKAEEITEQILSNLYKIICDNTISELADLFIQLYREGYSDIACILTTLLEADMYENAFQKSIPFQYDKDMYQDVFQKIRSLLVAESISSIEGGALSPELREKWKLYAKKLEAEIMEIKPPEGEDSKNLDGNSTENRGQNQSSHVMIQMTEQMAMCFQTYFGECAKEFVSTLDQIKGLQTFRAELKKVLDDENHNLLCRIVTGDFPEFQDNNNNSNQEA